MTSSAILERAKHIAEKQGRLARSPAELSPTGEITLCAASCLAKAALIEGGDVSAVEEFDSRVLREEKGAYVPAILRNHRFDLDAAAVMNMNDQLLGEQRLQWFRGL